MSDAITVVVADDHPVFRKGLTDVLASDASFRVVAEAGDGEAALAMIREHRPRIALLDIEMPKASGLEVAAAMSEAGLLTDIVFLTMYKEREMLRRALEIGAKGYLLKDSALTEIGACLHMIASGRGYVSAAMTGDLMDAHRSATDHRDLLAQLTTAEDRVLRLIAQGLTTPQVARELDISPKTVDNHRSHICRKLRLKGPQALLRFALENKSLIT